MEEQPLKQAPSFLTSLTNAFAAPSEAFQSLIGTEASVMQWLAPMLATFVMVVAFTYTLATNQTLHAQLVDQQRTSMEKLVSEGKMSQEQADAAIDRMEQGGTGLFMVFGTIGGAIFVALFYFGGALFLWLADKLVLKSPEGYGKHLELYGVASWIGVIGSIVALLMMVGLGSMHATPSAALAVMSSFDPMDKMHRLLGSLNIFSIWQTAVIGIGLSKFSGKSLGAGIGLAFALWVVWTILAVLLNIAR